MGTEYKKYFISFLFCLEDLLLLSSFISSSCLHFSFFSLFSRSLLTISTSALFFFFPPCLYFYTACFSYFLVRFCPASFSISINPSISPHSYFPVSISASVYQSLTPTSPPLLISLSLSLSLSAGGINRTPNKVLINLW